VLRYWLAAGGNRSRQGRFDDRGAAAANVANMKVGIWMRSAVGEPWTNNGPSNIGYTALTTGELWANHPEKALGMRAAWVDKYPPPPKRCSWP